MRRLGVFALLVGGAGFYYCWSEKPKYPPLPEDLSLSKAIHQPAGQLEIGEYAAAAVAVMGGLMLMFPQGR